MRETYPPVLDENPREPQRELVAHGQPSTFDATHTHSTGWGVSRARACEPGRAHPRAGCEHRRRATVPSTTRYRSTTSLAMPASSSRMNTVRWCTRMQVGRPNPVAPPPLRRDRCEDSVAGLQHFQNLRNVSQVPARLAIMRVLHQCIVALSLYRPPRTAEELPWQGALVHPWCRQRHRRTMVHVSGPQRLTHAWSPIRPRRPRPDSTVMCTLRFQKMLSDEASPALFNTHLPAIFRHLDTMRSPHVSVRRAIANTPSSSRLPRPRLVSRRRKTSPPILYPLQCDVQRFV